MPQPPTQPPPSTNYDPRPLPESDTYTSSSTSEQITPFNNDYNGLLKTHAHDLQFNLPQLLKVHLLQHIQIQSTKYF